jgi:hypothetical protein
MKRKCLLILAFIAIIPGFAFTQTMPRNTITVDVAPTIAALGAGWAGSLIDEEGISLSPGFGIGAQYEFQFFERLSVAARFAYLRGGMGFSTQEELIGVPVKGDAEFNFDSFSIEGHVRFYPFAGAFFVDGMAGWARMNAAADGDVVVNAFGISILDPINVKASRDFLKLGAKSWAGGLILGSHAALSSSLLWAFPAPSQKATTL